MIPAMTARAWLVDLDGTLSETVQWFLNLTYMESSFRDAFTVSSPNNPASVDGELSVQPGDRLPLVPDWVFKTGMSWEFSERLLLGFDVQANSGFHLRGDEGNDLPRIPGYAVWNSYASFAVTDRWRVFAGIKNLLDTEFETFGVFGEPDEVLGDEFDDTRFLSPGAPRGGWIGFEFLLN